MISRLVATSVVLIMLAGCAGSQQAAPPRSVGAQAQNVADVGPQPVIDWNVIALKTLASATTGRGNPPADLRKIAIVQASVYDAVITITGGHRPYLFPFPAERDANVSAAVATAAHDALTALFPTQQSSLDATYLAYMSGAAGTNVPGGVGVGHEVASALVEARTNDGSANVVPYVPGSGPGVWQPAPPGFAAAQDPGWGLVTPFLLRSGDQFRPGPPPGLTSDVYTADFNEIKSIGSATSTTRTADEAITAKFWLTTAVQLWNQAVQQLAVRNGLTTAATARAFALLNIAMEDSLIASFDSIYTYNFWRPITAIRNAASTGNPSTIADPAWTPLLPTPPTPEYVAPRSATAGAAEAALTAIFGPSPGSFQFVSTSTPGVVHTYTTFAQVSEENSDAQLWGGIQFRTSVNAGHDLGLQVGAFDVQHGLQPSEGSQ